ncbi:hypothetical protein BH10BAC1_BH10BAC1_12140 [soil metagenome]
MKKITLAFCFAAFSFSVINAQEDKAFHKGTITVDPSIGFAIYGTKSHSEYDENYWTGTGTGTRRVKKDTTDGAGSTIYGLTGEYGVTNWLGIGARFAYSHYIQEEKHDTVFFPTGIKTFDYKPKARSVDFGINVNFHLVKGKRFDMPICLTLGYSNFKLTNNNPDTDPSSYDNSGAVAKDNGVNYGILLMPKIYFGKEQHVGLAFHIGYMGYNYPSIKFSNNFDSNLNDDNNSTFKLKGNGFNIGIGLSVKF